MNELEGRLEDLLVPMDVAVIGCVVNGPGEAKEAHVGLTGGTRTWCISTASRRRN